MEEARRRLIVALDVPSTEAAEDMVRRLEGTCQWFKVGLELFTAAGPAVVEALAARCHWVSLGQLSKLIDICKDEGIAEYPTWIFADGTRQTGVLSLAQLSTKTGCPLPASATSTPEAGIGQTSSATSSTATSTL